MPLVELTQEKMEYLYNTLGISDTKIAGLFDTQRRTIIAARKKYGIDRHKSNRDTCLEKLCSKLSSLDIDYIDLKQEDKLNPADFILNPSSEHPIRVCVVTSTLLDNKYYYFSFSHLNKSSNPPQSAPKILTDAGRLRKVYSEVCDFVIFVGNKPGLDPAYWIMPSVTVDRDTKVTCIKIYNTVDRNKYSVYYNKWNMLKDESAVKTIQPKDIVV